MENRMPQVQHKHFTEDTWIPTEGNLYLKSLPSSDKKSVLA